MNKNWYQCSLDVVHVEEINTLNLQFPFCQICRSNKMDLTHLSSSVLSAHLYFLCIMISLSNLGIFTFHDSVIFDLGTPECGLYILPAWKFSFNEAVLLRKLIISWISFRYILWKSFSCELYIFHVNWVEIYTGNNSCEKHHTWVFLYWL